MGELVTVAEAAARVDRSRDTVRRWLRAGRLSRHEGVAPGGGSPPVLVDVDELMALAADGLAVEPPRAVRAAPDLAVELEAARGRLELAEVTARATVAEREALLLAAALADARDDRDAWRDRATRAEAELAGLRALAGVPWWRRLLG